MHVVGGGNLCGEGDVSSLTSWHTLNQRRLFLFRVRRVGVQNNTRETKFRFLHGLKLARISARMNLEPFAFVSIQAGPAGAHLGTIACHMVLIILFVEDRKWPLIKVGIFVGALLIFGLLPMVDNYAHIFGFIFGFLLSFAVLPFARFFKAVSASNARKRRYIAIGVCSAAAIGVALVLIILFYVAPIYECSWCHYFTCIPITADFCVNQEVTMRNVVEL